MPNFHYRALTQTGEMVTGSISAVAASEVARRIEYLGLIPVDTITEDKAAAPAGVGFRLPKLFNRPRPEDVTLFTRDLALLLKSGARIDDALDLLAGDIDVGRMRPVVGHIRARVMAGESFADSLAQHPTLFSPMYVALARVGEASGALDHILEVLGNERARGEALRNKLADALRYPAFVLFAAGSVLVFFLLFVLPQFGAVLRDFGAKLDPIVKTFLNLSDFLHAHLIAISAFLLLLILGLLIALRRADARAWIIKQLSRLPLVRPMLRVYRTALFCRNLGVLLGSGVALTTTLRILVDIMASTGASASWTKTIDHVRHGGKLSDALAETDVLPAMAVRMLRLGEETGQLAVLSGRVAEFYEEKLQRSLDRIVGIAGPVAIISISIIVGSLIVSIMTALLSVSQVIG
jgi:general secretion pathway protein F